jgi:hypothetical protein
VGDSQLWDQVDQSVFVQTDIGPRIFWIDVANKEVFDLDLSWYNSNNYDLIYQGIVDCIALPEVGLVAVAVQRSSELILIDPRQNLRIGAITLAGRDGNPTLSRRSATEFIASDYDCLCLVDAKTGAVRCSAVLQEPGPENTRQFIGDYDSQDTSCAVARPFSGDVLLLDLTTLAERTRAAVSGQPLEICMTSDSGFVTRDWKTGEVETGQFHE